jgi:hypothetical protein
MRLTLKLHPDSRCSAATQIDVYVTRVRAGSLELSYVVACMIGDLLLPPVTASARSDELWRHTCFEAFVRPSAGETYYEFNLAPSTHWAAYRFDRYRAGMRAATEIASPRIEVLSEPARYTLRAAIELSSIKLPGDAAWRVGLSAVIEERSGRKSYWALAHPPGNPDFHHADCFALALREA